MTASHKDWSEDLKANSSWLPGFEDFLNCILLYEWLAYSRYTVKCVELQRIYYICSILRQKGKSF